MMMTDYDEHGDESVFVLEFWCLERGPATPSRILPSAHKHSTLLWVYYAVVPPYSSLTNPPIPLLAAIRRLLRLTALDTTNIIKMIIITK